MTGTTMARTAAWAATAQPTGIRRLNRGALRGAAGGLAMRDLRDAQLALDVARQGPDPARHHLLDLRVLATFGAFGEVSLHPRQLHVVEDAGHVPGQQTLRLVVGIVVEADDIHHSDGPISSPAAHRPTGV